MWKNVNGKPQDKGYSFALRTGQEEPCPGSWFQEAFHSGSPNSCAPRHWVGGLQRWWDVCPRPLLEHRLYPQELKFPAQTAQHTSRAQGGLFLCLLSHRPDGRLFPGLWWVVKVLLLVGVWAESKGWLRALACQHVFAGNFTESEHSGWEPGLSGG